MNVEATITYEGGTLLVHGMPSDGPSPPHAVWDKRADAWRAPAVHYAPILLWLREHVDSFKDDARAYEKLPRANRKRHKPFPYQAEAIAAWRENDHRGVVVLPTGAGKTFVAIMAIDLRPRSTLVVVPTIDLLNQWYDLLLTSFPQPVGIIGGGYYDVQELTVTTYDSAYIHMDRLGNRFGLVVFDECHHLPSESLSLAALACLAPFRLGLTATPDRTDGGEARYSELVGPIVYQKHIDELSGDYLSEYETQRIAVDLTAEEREQYNEARRRYLSFVKRERIHFGSPTGWRDFLFRSSRTPEGREAFESYRLQKRLAMAAEAKLDALERLLHAHRHDRMIIFTEDNATVYLIARKFLIPAITHQTKIKERSLTLKRFNEGLFNAVVTSKVLNEGVNVPDANVAVILSGSGSVREHVQRLGRILRKREGKRAILYELVSTGTNEEGTSARRRDHRAYH